jgi:hypothetical protein
MISPKDMRPLAVQQGTTIAHWFQKAGDFILAAIALK